MEIYYMSIVAMMTFVFGAINKAYFESMPNRFIPIQNVFIGLISGIICYFGHLESDLLESIVLCIMAAMSSGGVSDMKDIVKRD